MHGIYSLQLSLNLFVSSMLRFFSTISLKVLEFLREISQYSFYNISRFDGNFVCEIFHNPNDIDNVVGIIHLSVQGYMKMFTNLRLGNPYC